MSKDPTDMAAGEACEDSAATAPGDDPGTEDLTAALAEAQARVQELRDEALRARAELDNVRKRAARDVENAHKYGLEKLITEILPIKDSMELGLAAAAKAEDIASVRAGMNLTLKMLLAALDRLGVGEVDPQGEKFNPDRHQAMTTEVTAAVEPGTVTAVIQKGYLLQDRLLRPALVTVATRPADSPD